MPLKIGTDGNPSTGGGGGTSADLTNYYDKGQVDDIAKGLRNPISKEAIKSHYVYQKASTLFTDAQLQTFFTAAKYKMVVMDYSSNSITLFGFPHMPTSVVSEGGAGYAYRFYTDRMVYMGSYNGVLNDNTITDYGFTWNSYFTDTSGIGGKVGSRAVFFPDGFILDASNYQGVDFSTEYSLHDGGGTVDLTDYYKKEEVTSLLSAKEDTFANRSSLEKLSVDPSGTFYINNQPFKSANSLDLTSYATKVDMDANRNDLQSQINALSNGMTFKGEVGTPTELPSEVTKGDAYVITNDDRYAGARTLNVFDGSSYTYLGSFDVSAGAVINDLGTNPTETWSAEKISSELSQKAETSTIYNKTEIDEKFQIMSQPDNVDLSGYYTRSEVDSIADTKEDLLANRASLDRLVVDASGKFYIDGNEFKPASPPPDLTPYYTKTDVDTKDANLQAQITSLGAGMTFKGTVANRAALMALTGNVKGDTWVVTTDEGNANAKTLNVYDGSSYIYLGSFSVTAGATILDSSNVSTTNTWSAQKIYNSLTAKGDKTVVDSNTTRISALESKTASGIPKYNTKADLPAVGSLGDTAVVIYENALYEFGQGCDTSKDISPTTVSSNTVAWGDGVNMVLSADSVQSGSLAAFYAFNGNKTSGSEGWLSASTNCPHWLSIDMGKARAVGGFGLYPYHGSNYQGWPSHFAVFGSTTGAFTGEELKLFESLQEPKAVDQSKRTYTFNQVYTDYRYLRIVIYEAYGNGLTVQQVVGFAEMEIYGPGWGPASLDANGKTTLKKAGELDSRVSSLELGVPTTIYPGNAQKDGHQFFDLLNRQLMVSEVDLNGIVPALTANTDKGFVVTSPTGITGNLYTPFQQVASNYFGFPNNGELMIKFPMAMTVLKLAMWGSTNASYQSSYAPQYFQVYGSSNGTTFTLLGDYTNTIQFDNKGTKTFFDITTPGSYQYYKLKVIDDFNGGSYNWIGGLQFYDTDWMGASPEVIDMGVVGSLLPRFQSAQQDDVVISDNGFYGIYTQSWLVADADLMTYFQSSNSAISTSAPSEITFQFCTAKTVKKLGIICPLGNYYVQDFSLLGSNDGSTWTSLLSVTANTSWATKTMRYWDIPTPANYRYYKVSVTKVLGGYCEIVSIDLLGDTKKKVVKKTTDSFTLAAAANKVLPYTGEVICQVLVDLGSGNYRALLDSDNVAVAFGASGVTITNNGAASINLKSFVL